MPDNAELKSRITMIDEQLKAARKTLRKAERAFKKTQKQADSQRENLQQMFSGYSEVTDLERQGHQGLTDWVNREASYVSQVEQEIRQLESQRKDAKKSLRQGQRAAAKAERKLQRAAEPETRPEPPLPEPVARSQPDAIQGRMTSLCELCGLYPVVALGMCSLCLEVAEAQRTGDFSQLSPAALRHALRLAKRLESAEVAPKREGGLKEEAATLATNLRYAEYTIVQQVAVARAGGTPDHAAITSAIAPIRDPLTAGGSPSAGTFIEAVWGDSSETSPADFADIVGPLLPDWLRKLCNTARQHDYNPRRHSLHLDDPMNSGSTNAMCSVCGLQGVGAEFYFTHDGGVCGPGDCQVCGLSEELHTVMTWLFS